MFHHATFFNIYNMFKDEIENEYEKLLQIMIIEEYYKVYLFVEPCKTSMLIGNNYVIKVVHGHGSTYDSYRMENNVFTSFYEVQSNYKLLNDSKFVS